MDKKTIIQKAKNAGIGACNIVADRIINNNVQEGDIVYVASTPQNSKYGGYEKNTTRAYMWVDNDFRLLFYNTTPHRAKVAIKNYKLYRNGTINPLVWNNYITNGYNTRRGLLRSDKNVQRMELLARSHADYVGCEINSSADHMNRVFMRN